MSDLVVLAFKDESGAAGFSSEISRMQKMNILSLEDAAIVTRSADGKPKVKQAHSLVGTGAFGGAFWGMLIGLLFLTPWLGLVFGVISGAFAGRFSVREEIEPGTSALFLMVAGSTPDHVLEELRGHTDIKVLSASLSHEAEVPLRDALATPGRDNSLERVA